MGIYSNYTFLKTGTRVVTSCGDFFLCRGKTITQRGATSVTYLKRYQIPNRLYQATCMVLPFAPQIVVRQFPSPDHHLAPIIIIVIFAQIAKSNQPIKRQQIDQAKITFIITVDLPGLSDVSIKSLPGQQPYKRGNNRTM